MHSIKVLVCVLLFITLVSSQTDYKILYSELSENMKDHAIGITLVAINEKVNNTELAKRLRNGFNKEYGPEWV
jgi:flagellar biosynthesis/type III secretory pathway M-ring protein FliF/YscJ